MLKVNIQDIKNKLSAKLAQNRSLAVHVLPHGLPRPGDPNVFRYFSAKLADAAGATNMNVDGSVTAQKFFLKAVQDSDIHIMSLIVVIADSMVSHNRFGNITGVVNGWDLQVTESGEITDIFTKAKTGGEVILQAGALWPFGNSLTSFELTDFTGVSDATIVNFPLYDILPLGIRLGRATKDKIESIINDDFTTLLQFDLRILGFKHFPFNDAEKNQ